MTPIMIIHTDVLGGRPARTDHSLQRFYNPTLYKAPPKKELSMEDSLYVKAGREEFAGLVQIRSHSRVAQAPEVFSGIQQPKTEKSTGVIALMTMMQKDLQQDIKDAEADEKAAQKEYEDLMTDSAATRAQTAKSITDKEASKADQRVPLRGMHWSRWILAHSCIDQPPQRGLNHSCMVRLIRPILVVSLSYPHTD